MFEKPGLFQTVRFKVQVKGLHYEHYSILGSMLGSRYFRKLPPL